MWSVTPGEFAGVLYGRMSADRDRRYWSAQLVVMESGGAVTVASLLGEREPQNADPSGVEGWAAGETEDERRERRVAFMQREALRAKEQAHRAWIPEGLGSSFVSVDDEEERDDAG